MRWRRDFIENGQPILFYGFVFLCFVLLVFVECLGELVGLWPEKFV